jgi:hypothetical protein
MCISLGRLIKIEKKWGFVETNEEFEKTDLVIEKDK